MTNREGKFPEGGLCTRQYSSRSVFGVVRQLTQDLQDRARPLS